MLILYPSIRFKIRCWLGLFWIQYGGLHPSVQQLGKANSFILKLQYRPIFTHKSSDCSSLVVIGSLKRLFNSDDCCTLYQKSTSEAPKRGREHACNKFLCNDRRGSTIYSVLFEIQWTIFDIFLDSIFWKIPNPLLKINNQWPFHRNYEFENFPLIVCYIFCCYLLSCNDRSLLPLST